MPRSSKTILTWTMLAIGALLLAVVAAVGVTAVTLPGCVSCHDSGDFATETAGLPHADVSCVSCHVDPSVGGRLSFASRQLFHMIVPVVRDLDRSYAAVPAERCISCHEAVRTAGTQGSRGLRIDHVQCAAGIQCSQCHSATAHGTATTWPRTPRMEQCYTCHGATNKVIGCDSCHAERREEQRVQAGTFSVTHGPNWESTHGMGEMRSCGACHEPEKCMKCHGAGVPHAGDFLSQHAKFSTQTEARCTSCHLETFCTGCHEYPMPHDEAFIIGHSDIVDTDGDTRCLTCHAQSDCTGCHESHVHPVTQEQMDGIRLKTPGASR